MDKVRKSPENRCMDSRCVIYVFSGTGNTRLVAEKYRESFDGNADIFDIASDYRQLPMPDRYDIVGIGYPVHAFNAPEIVIDFAKFLHCGERKNLFIFHTGGEGLFFNDSSSLLLRRILRRKFCILSEMHFVMPYNMIFRHDERMVKHMVTYMNKLVPFHAEMIARGEREKIRPMPIRHLISFLLRIEWFYARFQGRTMKADGRCTSCSLCERNCPMDNIRIIDGRPHFGTNCALCVRCSFFCPEGAISIGLLERWKVNGRYPIERIMKDESIPETIPVEKLSVLYRRYYRNCSALSEKEMRPL